VRPIIKCNEALGLVQRIVQSNPSQGECFIACNLKYSYRLLLLLLLLLLFVLLSLLEKEWFIFSWEEGIE
jgi:hypothetical protein